MAQRWYERLQSPTRLLHRGVALADGSTKVLIAPDPGCEGRIRQLYERRSNPQRWQSVGWVCDGCGATDLRLGRLEK